MTKSSNLPAPYGGVRENLPVAALESPYCENLFNFNVTQAGVELRHGDSKLFGLTFAADARAAKRLVSYNTSLFVVTFNNSTLKVEIYNSAGTIVYTSAALAGSPYFNSVIFKKVLFIFDKDGLTLPITYNGAAWGTAAFGGSFIGAAVGSGTVFKERLYFTSSTAGGGPSYYYFDIEAITGNPTVVDLSSFFSTAQNLAFVVPLTLADTAGTETLLAFVSLSGEALFYSGSYPDSANWQLVGRVQLGRVLDYSSYLQYQGDVLVFCDNGVVSLRDMFLKGSTAATGLTVNQNIQKTWQELARAMRVGGSNTLGVHGIWDSISDKIIIAFPAYINSSGTLVAGSFYFVFDTLQNAWSFHRSYGAGTTGTYHDVILVDYTVYTLASKQTALMVYKKEAATGFTDRSIDDTTEVAYDYELLSAPIPFPKTAVYETTQIEPILESDLYAQTNWNLVADFGRQTSGDQKTDAATTSVAKPAVNVGMQNITFVQVKMSGTTTTSKTVGLDLYSYNVWYNSGETGSR